MVDVNMQDSSLKKKLDAVGLPTVLKYNSKEGTRILKNGKRSKRRIDTLFRLLQSDSENIIISKSWALSDHLVLKRKLKLAVDRVSEQLVYDKKMLENHKVIKKLRRKLRNQHLNMMNLPEIIRTSCRSLGIYRRKRVYSGLPMRWRHVKVFKEKRLAAKTVMRNFNEANSIRFVFLKEQAELTRRLIRKDRSSLWALRGVKLFRSNRSREFWRWLKNSRSTSIRLDQVALMDQAGILYTCQERKLEIANQFYANLASENGVDINIYNKSNLADPPTEITEEELISALKKCGNNKAAGPDEIPTELYKHLLCNEVEDSFFRFMLSEFNKYISGDSPP